MGALVGACVWLGLSLLPNLWMLALWTMAAAWWTGSAMFGARPTAFRPSFWSNALITALILLGSAIEDSANGDRRRWPCNTSQWTNWHDAEKPAGRAADHAVVPGRTDMVCVLEHPVLRAAGSGGERSRCTDWDSPFADRRADHAARNHRAGHRVGHAVRPAWPDRRNVRGDLPLGSQLFMPWLRRFRRRHPSGDDRRTHSRSESGPRNGPKGEDRLQMDSPHPPARRTARSGRRSPARPVP